MIEATNRTTPYPSEASERYAKGLDCAEAWIREAQDLSDAQKDELLGLIRGVRSYAAGGEPIWIVGMLRAMRGGCMSPLEEQEINV